jgi:hypothetical protein
MRTSKISGCCFAGRGAGVAPCRVKWRRGSVVGAEFLVDRTSRAHIASKRYLTRSHQQNIATRTVGIAHERDSVDNFIWNDGGDAPAGSFRQQCRQCYQSDGPLPKCGAATLAKYPPAYAPKKVEQVETAGGGTAAQ